MSTTHSAASVPRLADFTTDLRVIPLSFICIGIGVVGAFLALILLKLIYLFTNLFFFHRFSLEFTSPAQNTLGYLVILVPILGGLIVGIMARFGSERIRGHGIPEAIEAILLRGAKVEPRVAVLKPVSAAIAIGSGGPFGAEGPIIMTGGAVGSLIAQFFHMSGAERKTLLVAGAAAGMSATFAAPVSAVLLAVELLLFEWKPRSLIPVAMASATAAAARHYLLGVGPLFPIPEHHIAMDAMGLAACMLVGLLAGLLAALLSSAIYLVEDGFARLPVHWMWWPAIGAAAVGIGGYFFPQALGVGYDVIASMLDHDLTLKVLLGIFLVKGIIWSVSLGSGTSGGVLAPLLMMGGALGGLEARFLPHYGTGLWPLVSMAAVLAGALGAPLTAVVFAFELTHDPGVLLPLLISALVSYGLVVLTLPRSILTEKLSRRGYHLSREYIVDPMESLAVEEVMRTQIARLTPDASLDQLREALQVTDNLGVQRLFPVEDQNRKMLGVVPRWDLEQFVAGRKGPSLSALIIGTPVTAYSDERLTTVVQRMASSGFTKLPVVKRGEPEKVVGIISIADLLKARSAAQETEELRERVLQLSVPLVFRGQDDDDSKRSVS
ncbi:MAG: chloride channel protein [Acidobacteria bacterium]|nr:MAG: chloride channel protein [Acidobacteriota bacterium]